jgi:hypothetical protein
MIRIITTDDLPVKLQIKSLDRKISLLRDRLVSAPEELKDELRAELQHVIQTRTRIGG